MNLHKPLPELQDIETVVWDLDGTLLNSFEIHVELVAQLWPRYGFDVPSIETMAHHFHGRLEDSLRGLLGDIEENRFQDILTDFLVIDNEYMKDVNDHLFIDAVGFGLKLREQGAKQILLTNRAHGVNRGTASPRYMAEHSQLKDFIDLVICGDEVEHRKPDARVFDGKNPAIIPEKTVVVGDQSVDAQLAKNLGCSAILVNRNHHDIPHIEQIGEDWENYTTIVTNLNQVISKNGG